MSLKKIYILLIVISPFFWWQFINKQNQIFLNYLQVPSLILNKTTSIINNTQYSNEFIWNNSAKKDFSYIIKKSYYKIQSLLDESIKYINNLNPRFYFQSGSGQTDSPSKVEPIAILLLPCTFFGILKLFNKYKFKLLFIGLISCFLGYITALNNIYFLFPVALFYLYAAAYEIFSWNKKNQKLFLFILIFYNLFLFFRVIFV